MDIELLPVKEVKDEDVIDGVDMKGEESSKTNVICEVKDEEVLTTDDISEILRKKGSRDKTNENLFEKIDNEEEHEKAATLNKMSIRGRFRWWLEGKFASVNQYRKAFFRHSYMTVSLESDAETSWKWVVIMVLVGCLDTLASLVKAVQFSKKSPALPRLLSGSLFYTEHESILPTSVRLALCFFTAVGCLFFIPETFNTISAWARFDGTTIVPLHFELLLSLLFKHIPLATISYFTSSWRFTTPEEMIPKYARVIELVTTSIRIFFLSLRILWYSHIEGRKLRKNDKYELSQVIFLLAILLFSVTLAIPIMTTRLRENELDFQKPDFTSLRSNLSCQDTPNASIVAEWEWLREISSGISGEFDDGENQSEFIEQVTSQTQLLNMDYDRKGYVWKIFLDESHNPQPHHSYLFQKKLRISVCDLYNVGEKGIIVEYKCPILLSSGGYDHFSLLSMFNEKYADESRLHLCLPNVDRVLFRFQYIPNHKQDQDYKDSSNAELGVQRVSTRRKEQPIKLSKLLKKNFKSLKEETSSAQASKNYDEIRFEVGAFCRSQPYKCQKIVFDPVKNKTTNNYSDKSNTSRHNNKYKNKNIPPRYTPPNFLYRFDRSGEFVDGLEPVSANKLPSNAIKYSSTGNSKQTETPKKTKEEKMNKNKPNKPPPSNVIGNDAETTDKSPSDVCSLYAALEEIDWRAKGGSQRFEACLHPEKEMFL